MITGNWDVCSFAYIYYSILNVLNLLGIEIQMTSGIAYHIGYNQ